MRIDVSELKTYRECKRKHQLSSRNRFHLAPLNTNNNLIFGTQFHECLHMMYLGTSLERIHEWMLKEIDDADYLRMMYNMVDGYYNGPYQKDIKKYTVIDIEKNFSVPIIFSKDGEVLVEACGSIDMICIENETNRLVGFEHKTAKNFRTLTFNNLDEQPRTYFMALKEILDDFHAKGKYFDVTETGYILINEVKKLKTKFEYARIKNSYSNEDIANFMVSFRRDAAHILEGDYNCNPEPNFMKCQMCDYAEICSRSGYENVDLEEIIEEFSEEFRVRDHDHLDEKIERNAEVTDGTVQPK